MLPARRVTVPSQRSYNNHGKIWNRRWNSNRHRRLLTHLHIFASVPSCNQHVHTHWNHTGKSHRHSGTLHLSARRSATRGTPCKTGRLSTNHDTCHRCPRIACGLSACRRSLQSSHACGGIGRWWFQSLDVYNCRKMRNGYKPFGSSACSVPRVACGLAFLFYMIPGSSATVSRAVNKPQKTLFWNSLLPCVLKGPFYMYILECASREGVRLVGSHLLDNRSIFVQI